MVYFCKDVCSNFKIMNIPEYFFPQIQKLKSYNNFLERSLSKILNNGGADAESSKAIDAIGAKNKN